MGREKNSSVHGFCGREYENTGGAHAAQDVRGVCGGRAGRDDIVDDHDALTCERNAPGQERAGGILPAGGGVLLHGLTGGKRTLAQRGNARQRE